ncbi:MAG: TetR/AcrR family transcriptional regulator [Henriciella sp.]|nr:TetR/AcrR family transcriptional regulator [Henriciella sp.]
MANMVKVTRDGWIEAAKTALIEDGLAGTKVDRLAKQLGVSRGGFYHNFGGHDDILKALLSHWVKSNAFLPDPIKLRSPADSVEFLDRIMARLILEEEFSPKFEIAIREWGRIDQGVLSLIEEVDEKRIAGFIPVFIALGCDENEAITRSKVLYYHQMGYYLLGHHQKETKEERLAGTAIYMRILCGRRFLEAASEAGKRWL